MVHFALVQGGKWKRKICIKQVKLVFLKRRGNADYRKKYKKNLCIFPQGVRVLWIWDPNLFFKLVRSAVQSLMDFLFSSLLFRRVFLLISIRKKPQESMLSKNVSSEGLNRTQPKTPIKFWSTLRDCYDHAGSSRLLVVILLHTIPIYAPACKIWASYRF